jgi:integrase
MMLSLSKNTLSQYTSSLKKWWQYCQMNAIDDIYDVKINYLIDFLNRCLEDGASYGTLNSHRSAISLISINHISQDDCLKRFFKGVFRIKPSFPRYTVTWDPMIVLDYFSNLYPNETLPIEHIAKKNVILLALATGQRSQTLSLIRLNNVQRFNDRIIINTTDLIKTSGIGRCQPVLDLPFFTEKISICPAQTLLDYIKFTKNNRPLNETRLILTFKRPYHAASSQTIGRWIKQAMEESGVDVGIFRPHSTRHAATSSASLAGVSVDVIRKTAGWSRESAVFANFYKRPIVNHNNFTESVFRG